jgi:hypothetical protein
MGTSENPYLLSTSVHNVPVGLTRRFVAGLSCCLTIFCIGLMGTSVAEGPPS